MSLSREAGYDWTFSYDLSRRVFCKESSDNNTIKFVKDSNNNLTGFKIEVKNKTESKAKDKSEIKKKKLERVLTILSGMELKAIPAGAEGVPRKPGLRTVYNNLTVKYDIEGSIDNIDMTDTHIRKIIDQEINPELDRELHYLNDAVAHKSHGRFSESIKEAFRVIDEKHYSTSIRDYHEYECIRDILSHREGQHLREKTKGNLFKFFDPVNVVFDFMHRDESNKIFIFDLDSPKTKQTLEHLAKDLIQDVKRNLGL